MLTVTHQRRLEVESLLPQNDDDDNEEDIEEHFESVADFISKCRERPQELGNLLGEDTFFIRSFSNFGFLLDIYVRHLDTAPDFWNEMEDDEYDEFPPGGILLVFMKLPSTTRSWTSKENFRHVSVQ